MADWNQRIIDEFRAHDGTVTTSGFGRNLVLLHHVGARTGAARVSPVAAVHPDSGSWLVAASKGGAPENPAWFHNLLAHPDTVIETPDDGTVEVHARVLAGSDREAGWARMTSLFRGFASYEQKTSRVIPVVELRRR